MVARLYWFQSPCRAVSRARYQLRDKIEAKLIERHTIRKSDSQVSSSRNPPNRRCTRESKYLTRRSTINDPYMRSEFEIAYAFNIRHLAGISIKGTRYTCLYKSCWRDKRLKSTRSVKQLIEIFQVSPEHKEITRCRMLKSISLTISIETPILTSDMNSLSGSEMRTLWEFALLCGVDKLGILLWI